MRATRTLRAAASATALTAALVCVPAAAHADEPAVFVEVTYTGWAPYTEPCFSTEVWGVVAPQGSPERQKGNYQVCTYSSSGVALNPWKNNIGTAEDSAAAKTHIITESYGEPTPRTLRSLCTYWMPAGPNRSPIISSHVDTYQVKLVFKYADGTTKVVDTTQGTYTGGARVTWTPGCWT